jgi:hypothetical protein
VSHLSPQPCALIMPSVQARALAIRPTDGLKGGGCRQQAERSRVGEHCFAEGAFHRIGLGGYR